MGPVGLEGFPPSLIGIAHSLMLLGLFILNLNSLWANKNCAHYFTQSSDRVHQAYCTGLWMYVELMGENE